MECREKSREADKKFSKWSYTRPDYADVKKKLNDCKSKLQNAMSYQMFRDV